MSRNILPFKRYDKNPILTKEDLPYPSNTVFNAAACKMGEEYVLVLRVEDRTGCSHLALSRSQDGYQFKVDPQPWVRPSTEPFYEIYERYGIEDPRVTQIEDIYYITYTAFGPYGTRVGIGYTKDFVDFKRFSLATEVDNKDAALFPEKIGNDYVMIDRPVGRGQKKGSIWINYSPDLIHWGRAKVILAPEPGWGNTKLGISTPPIKTEKGWLSLYHGVRETAGGKLYRVGAILLDLENPEIVIGNSPQFIFGPQEQYERIGDVPNVVFPCGLILEDNGTVKMYYGAADTCIGMAEGK
ncbi:glycosidase, partial [Thermodesulfobacteriota bacterium]